MNSSSACNVDEHQKALRQAGQSLASKPAESLAQVQALLNENPNDISAALIKGSALRLLGQTHEALETLSALEDKLPNDPARHYDIGLCFGALGDNQQAEKHLRRTVELEPANSSMKPIYCKHLDILGIMVGVVRKYD